MPSRRAAARPSARPATKTAAPRSAPAAAAPTLAAGAAPADLEPAQAPPPRHDANAFDAWSSAHLRETAKLERASRGGSGVTGGNGTLDTATLAARGAVLEVRFADGSSYFTAPVDFVREHVDPPKPTRAGAPPDLTRIALPFELASRRGPRTRAAAAGAAVERYTVSQLTEPTTLDTLFNVAETFRHTARRWFGVDSVDTKALPVAAKLCAAFENSALDDAVGSGGGVLLQWRDGGWQPLPAALPDDHRPVLLFLHGTGSSTAGSFGKLHERKDGAPWPADWAALAESHLLLGWEHRTLTLSPVDNTIALVEALLARLPGTRRVDVVSHSRGGLVGELFSLRTAPDDERKLARAEFASHFQATPRAGEGSLSREPVRGSARGRPGEVSLVPQGRTEPGRPRAEPVSTDSTSPNSTATPAHPDAKNIDALFDALDRAAPRFAAGCFVRVACPARGTLLADGRTDLFLSLMLRAVSAAAGSLGGGVGAVIVDRIGKLVRSLVAARADAKTLPGLEAMMPGSPLTLALADSSAKPTDRLRVVAGDAAASGLAGLLTLVADVFYGWHDHDYVVHTRSMFGGLTRSSPGLSLRWENPAVSHFAYFGIGSLARSALVAALAGRDEAFRSMVDDERQTRGSPAERMQRGAFQVLKAGDLNRPDFARWLAGCNDTRHAHKPVLVVLAGIMGSELKAAEADNDGPVWLSLGSMLSGDIEALQFGGADDQRLQASGLLAVSYWRLLERAQASFNVIAVPFDWRRPVADSGRMLAERIERIVDTLADRSLPVHVLAHSMGGLVARHALYIDGPGREQWAALRKRGSRLVQLGTPNRGSYSPAQLLLGQHGLSQVLGVLARKVSAKDLSRFGAGFPGLMEMLPQKPDAAFDDLFQPAAWKQVQERDGNAIAPDAAVLAAARAYIGSAAFRKSFDEMCADPQVFYVAGTGSTVVQMRPASNPWNNAFDEAGTSPAPGIEFLAAMEGDGTVPWTSALAPERTWYAPCEHGTLPDHTDSIEAYFELLLTGATRRLPQQRPVQRGSAAERELVVQSRAPLPALVPTSDEELARLLLQSVGGTEAQSAVRADPIEVRVVHGGLDYARHPLMVGHYLNERPSGAAKRVDEKLEGQVERVLALKLFEGAARTAHYLRPNNHDKVKPPYPGALLLGLGTIGELTPAVLSETVTRGILRYAFEHVHRDPYAPDGDGPVELRLSSVLIGTQIQAVTIRDSLAGLLYGVWAAAQLLTQMGSLGRAVRIRELELIEIDETTALDTAYELKRLLSRNEWSERLVWPRGVLEVREGALSGYRQRSSSGTWQRLVVKQDDTGGLSFALIGERARVESTQVYSDVASLRRFMDRISDDRADAGDALTGATDPRLGGVLFQMLLPNDLKSRLANLDNTVLVVDDETARYPWELLSPPLASAADGDVPRPFVVHAGLVRQRVTQDFRRLPQPVVGYNALVIGSPSTVGWADERGEPIAFSDLPGAREEAEAVARILRDDARPWNTLALIGPPPGEGVELGFEKIRVALLERPCRLLHLSGHGVVEQWIRRIGDSADGRALRKTGLVLSHQELLGAADVEQMSPAPEFVFINACYSGRDGEMSQAGRDGAMSQAGVNRVASLAGAQRAKQQAALASSLAQRFIAMGTKAVVAAGWQVDDAAALDFARAFYKALLGTSGVAGQGQPDDGLPFGDAVKTARAEVHRLHGARCNTWGAYQCYGDPQWRLSHDAAEGESQLGSARLRGAEQCMSAGELATRILQIEAVAGDKPPSELFDQLQQLQSALQADPQRREWLRDSRVRAALGTAYRELGDHKQAADHYQRGARTAYSQVQIGQLDGLVNSLVREGSPEGRQAALRLLELLNDIGDDAQARWPLDGSPSGEPTAASERLCLQGEHELRETSIRVAALPARYDPGEAACAAVREALYAAAATFARSYGDKRGEGDEPSRCAHALASALLAAGLATLLEPRMPRRDARQTREARWWLAEADRLIDALDAADDLSDFASGSTQIELLGARHVFARTQRLAERADDAVKRCEDGIAQVMVRWPSPIELEGLRHRFELVRALAERLPPQVGEVDLVELKALASYALEKMLQPRYVKR